MQQTMSELRTQMCDLKKIVSQNAERNEMLEARSRRNNLIIYRIDEQ